MKTKKSYVKNVWSSQEDTILSEAVRRIGPSKWSVIASLLEGRTAKQCRERWHNHLNVGIRKGEWSEEDDLILLRSQAKLGNQWSKIAKCLDGRSDTDTKNRFFVLQRAKKRSEECKVGEKYKIKFPIHHDKADQSNSLYYCNEINKGYSSNTNSGKVGDNGKFNSNSSLGQTSSQSQSNQSNSNTIISHSTSSRDSIDGKNDEFDQDKDSDNNSDTSERTFSDKSDSSIPSDIGMITSVLCKYLANRLS